MVIFVHPGPGCAEAIRVRVRVESCNPNATLPESFAFCFCQSFQSDIITRVPSEAKTKSEVERSGASLW